MTKLNFFYLSILLLLTVKIIYSQDQGDDIQGAQIELSIQNQTSGILIAHVENVEMAHENNRGCYFSDVIYYENYLQNIPAYHLNTNYGFTIQGDDYKKSKNHEVC